MMLDGVMSKLLILMLNLYLVMLLGNCFYCVRIKLSLNFIIINMYCIINVLFIRFSDKYYLCILIKILNMYVLLGDCVEYGFFFIVCLFV